MSAPDLHRFVRRLLEDLHARVDEEDGLLWAEIPPSGRPSLDLPDRLVATFDPARGGEFGAELVAPGSYLLDRMLSLAMVRGRHEAVRMDAVSPGWVAETLDDAGLADRALWEVQTEGETFVALFGFRITMTSDEKQEQFRIIAVRPGEDLGWEIPWSLASSPLSRTRIDSDLDLHPLHEVAIRTLSALSLEDIEGFRKAALGSLEQEVRRIFRFYDGALQAAREASRTDGASVGDAIKAERDRRLEEALERFEPRASARLVSVRVVFAPSVHAVRREGAHDLKIRIDAFTRRVRGLRCETCRSEDGPWSCVAPTRCARCGPTEAGSVRPPIRPPSGIPR